jgi:hypothetical protein
MQKAMGGMFAHKGKHLISSWFKNSLLHLLTFRVEDVKYIQGISCFGSDNDTGRENVELLCYVYCYTHSIKQILVIYCIVHNWKHVRTTIFMNFINPQNKVTLHISE